jgi:hypothetical protein
MITISGRIVSIVGHFWSQYAANAVFKKAPDMRKFLPLFKMASKAKPYTIEKKLETITFQNKKSYHSLQTVS